MTPDSKRCSPVSCWTSIHRRHETRPTLTPVPPTLAEGSLGAWAIRDRASHRTHGMRFLRSNQADRPVPGPGQESVWDYPRPPRVEPSGRRVRIVVEGVTIVDTTRAYRVLETSHPPAWYVPPEDVRLDLVESSAGTSFCEYKGRATYRSLRVGDRVIRDAAWVYEQPAPGFEAIAHHLAFYPGRVDACYVDDERVLAQAGDFYGGWVTSDIVGPFKGGPGTIGW